MLSNQKILNASFYQRNTVTVALELLGKVLVHKTKTGVLAGKIVEVEAYLGDADPACHAAKGKTNRGKIFWGAGGKAYVFMNYGIHYCLNTITGKVNVPECVLIRALEPISGVDIMKANRSNQNLKTLTNGPGKLTQAMGINKSHNGVALTKGNLVIRNGDKPEKIFITSRIGISKAKDEPLRFFIAGNEFVTPAQNVSVFYEGCPESSGRFRTFNK